MSEPCLWNSEQTSFDTGSTPVATGSRALITARIVLRISEEEGGHGMVGGAGIIQAKQSKSRCDMAVAFAFNPL
jgi:hypothetical protein